MYGAIRFDPDVEPLLNGCLSLAMADVCKWARESRRRLNTAPAVGGHRSAYHFARSRPKNNSNSISHSALFYMQLTAGSTLFNYRRLQLEHSHKRTRAEFDLSGNCKFASTDPLRVVAQINIIAL